MDQGGLPSELPEIMAITRILNQRLIISIFDPSPVLRTKTVQISINQKYLFIYDATCADRNLSVEYRNFHVKLTMAPNVSRFQKEKVKLASQLAPDIESFVIIFWIEQVYRHVYKIQEPWRM